MMHLGMDYTAWALIIVLIILVLTGLPAGHDGSRGR